MSVPLLIVVNGLPGSGKSTLAKRLSNDCLLPHFSRDGIYETLYDALDCRLHGQPPFLASATFTFLYSIASELLSVGQSLIVDGFFGRPALRSAEFLELKQRHDFESLQIMCKADGQLLVERFLARMHSPERHTGHSDTEWFAENQERLLRGELEPLSLGGQILEFDSTSQDSNAYNALLQHVQVALASLTYQARL